MGEIGGPRLVGLVKVEERRSAMVKKLWTVTALVLLIAACDTVTLGADTVRGSGTVTEVAVDVGPFTRILLAGQGDVTVTPGSVPGLTVETDENLHEYVEVTVEESTLVISTRNGVSLDPSDGIRYTVVTPGIDAVELSGSGSIHAAAMTVATMDARLSGSGAITFDDIDVVSLVIEIPGSGVATVSGTGRRGDFVVSGSGSIAAADLQLQGASVAISGSGTAEVWVSDELAIMVSGSGAVGYYGDPQLDESITGSGSVTARGDK